MYVKIASRLLSKQEDITINTIRQIMPFLQVKGFAKDAKEGTT
jgi:hypothetical protein